MQVVVPSSRLGLGTSRLASLGSSISLENARILISTALDHGISVIDTADAYASGDSERYIGRIISERRKECFLMTKAGLPYVAFPALLSPLNQVGKKLLQRLGRAKDYSKRYLLRSIERSLIRLRTDHVDAFFLHEPRPGELTSESWEALDEIRRQGKSRFTGVSTDNTSLLEEGLASGQVQIVQTPISLLSPHAEEIIQLCARHRVPVVANEVLKPLSLLASSGRVWEDLRRSYGACDIDTVRLLIAYAAAQEGVATVLVGTKSPAHLIANKEALRFSESMRPLFTAMKDSLT